MTRMTSRPQCGGGGRVVGGLLLLGGVDLGGLELRHTGVERLRLAGPGGGGVPHAIGEGGEPVDLGGLLGGHLGEAGLVGFSRREVLRVGASVLDDGAGGGLVGAVEVQHARDGLVEQVEVVADHDERAVVAAEELEHPLLGVGVEVVGGLVEQQHVAAREEDAGQFSTRRRSPPDSTPRGRSSRSSVRPRPAAMRRASHRRPRSHPRGGSASSAWLNRAHVSGIGSSSMARRSFFDAQQRVVEPPAAEDALDGGDVVGDLVEAGVLREVAEAAGDMHHAGLGLGAAAQHPQQAGLAGTVAADEADLVARRTENEAPLDDEVASRPPRSGHGPAAPDHCGA